MIYETQPSSVLAGGGCPQCHRDKLAKAKLKNHEWYLNELKTKNPTVIPLEEYQGQSVSILHKCLIHNIEWKTLPDRVLRGCGCSKCKSDRISLSKLKTDKEYRDKLATKQPNIIPIEKYINEETDILHKCLSCGYEWETKPIYLLHANINSCPNCGKHVRKTHKQFVKLLQNKNPDIEVLEEYKSVEYSIECKCKKHNYIFTTFPITLLKGGGCPLCYKEKISITRRKTNQAFIDELKIKNPYVINIENYNGHTNRITFKCLKCGYEFKSTPASILSGNGCHRCNRSKGENQIEEWLIENNIEYEPQKRFKDCRDVFPLSFDFYLPKENKCIEFDGEQHYKAKYFFGGQDGLEYLQKHDQMKNDYCKTHNINLLRIPYNADIEKELSNFLFN